MASVFITVFSGAASVASGNPLQHLEAVIDGADSAKITGDKRRHYIVRMFAEADCWVKWGSNPTATGASDSIPLGAENPEYFDIEAEYVITAITRT